MDSTEKFRYATILLSIIKSETTVEAVVKKMSPDQKKQLAGLRMTGTAVNVLKDVLPGTYDKFLLGISGKKVLENAISEAKRQL